MQWVGGEQEGGCRRETEGKRTTRAVARGGGDGVINGLCMARALNAEAGAKRFTRLRALSVDASVGIPASVVSLADSMFSQIYCTAVNVDCAACASEA